MENLNQWFYAKHPLMWLIAIFGVLLNFSSIDINNEESNKSGL